MTLENKGFLRHITKRMYEKRAAMLYQGCSIYPIGSEYSLKSCSSAELFSTFSDNAILKMKTLIGKKLMNMSNKIYK